MPSSPECSATRRGGDLSVPSPDTTDELVAHLVRVPDFWKGRADAKIGVWGVVGGLILVIAAALRAALTGEGQIFADILLAGAVIALLFLYGNAPLERDRIRPGWQRGCNQLARP
jgi:hypothetical protein